MIQSPIIGVKIPTPVAIRQHGLAMERLGRIYERGAEGVPRNLTDASHWYAAAAKQYAKAAKTNDFWISSRDEAIEARDRVTRQLAATYFGATDLGATDPTPSPLRPWLLALDPPTPTPPALPLAPSAPPRQPAGPTPPASPRRALVIGNTAYPTQPLRNPVHDARAMAQFLAEEAGFQLSQGRVLLDLDRLTLASAIGTFADEIQRGDTVLFYFSGHGLEREGQNYLLPVDFAATDAAQLRREAPTAQEIQHDLVRGQPGMLILILDACRNLPDQFKSVRGRSGGVGLGAMSTVAAAAVQQIIMFATAPGTLASDGGLSGQGTFTHCFLQGVKQPGLDSRLAFDHVVRCVLDRSQQEQRPFLTASQWQPFVFVSD